MSVESLKDTIVPKSDQLNADDLITGPVTVQITSIKRGNQEQPISIGISGGFQPYKPCKSMRRVMSAFSWSDFGTIVSFKLSTLIEIPPYLPCTYQ